MLFLYQVFLNKTYKTNCSVKTINKSEYRADLHDLFTKN